MDSIRKELTKIKRNEKKAEEIRKCKGNWIYLSTKNERNIFF